MEEHQNLKTLGQFSRYQLLKKTTQLLLSVSVFSLLLSNSSRLSFLHPSNSYFSTVPLKLFSHTIDKNCIFLLCNGLFIFVAKFSGLISITSRNNSYNSIENTLYYEQNEALVPLALESSKVTLLEKEENVVNGENRYVSDQETGGPAAGEFHREDDGEQETNNGFLISEKLDEVSAVEDDKQHSDEKFQVLDQEEEQEPELLELEYEDEDEDEENGMLTTEELNKKFEEFIKKMKEEIRFEAQQQLVMVN